MDRRTHTFRTRARWTFSLAMALVVGAFLLPAGAHHNPRHTRNQIRQLKKADRQRFTKAQSNRRFINANEQASDAAQLGGRDPGEFGLGAYCDSLAVPESYGPCIAPSIVAADDGGGNDVGRNTSVAIGADGLPIISYQDVTAFSLKVAHCEDPSCTTLTATTVDDPAQRVGFDTSLAIGTDGLPVISHYDVDQDALKVAHCDDLACTSASSNVVDDPPANDVGITSSIAIGADGHPVVAYHDRTARSLKVARCDDVPCSAVTPQTVDDPPGGNTVGEYSAVAVGADGLPIVSYYDETALNLKVAHCDDAACTGATITTVDDHPNDLGWYTSIAIGADGLPVISYYDDTVGALKVARCENTACTAATVNTVDDVPGKDTAIAIGADGLPVIAYRDDSSVRSLKMARCGDPACANAETTTVDDHPSNLLGYFASLAIGVDGRPVIAYNDTTANVLKVARPPVG